MELKFRPLRADEVDVRVATANEKGVSLLLYKDARCDMNILDETVGPMNWRREHSRDNANCTVLIWDEEKKQWIGKEDTGTESNTEAAKGLASDSFKRACFNWGIGRELYTAPSIWVSNGKGCTVSEKNGRNTCFDRFVVTDMEVHGGKITLLKVENEKTHMPVYEYKVDLAPVLCQGCGKPIKPIKKRDGSIWPASDIAEWTKAQHGKSLCWDCHKVVKADGQDV